MGWLVLGDHAGGMLTASSLGPAGGGEQSCPGTVSPRREGVRHSREVYSAPIRKVYPVLEGRSCRGCEEGR